MIDEKDPTCTYCGGEIEEDHSPEGIPHVLCYGCAQAEEAALESQGLL